MVRGLVSPTYVGPLLSNHANSSPMVVIQGLEETTRKVKSALMPAIEEHMTSTEFSPKNGLDFLDTKNTLLLSYLIDLTVNMRDRLAKKEAATNMRRLVEMRTVLDKARALDKKLRYQVDKVLAANGSSSSYAVGEGASDDPLQFRPLSDSFEGEGDVEDDSSSSGSDVSSTDGSEEQEYLEIRDNDDDDDDDDDLAAAKTILMSAKGKMNKQSVNVEQEQAELLSRPSEASTTATYRAPRHTAVPYTNDTINKEEEREKRQMRRLRASELAQTIRSQYGDTPDQEDVHGGAELGRQREGARRLTEYEAAKTRFEEESMIRLTTTRKEKKERNRVMRQESSNLSAIADLGSLVRDTTSFTTGSMGRRQKSTDNRGLEATISNDRFSNGKRKRQQLDNDGKVIDTKKGKKSIQARNDLQAELFRGGDGADRSSGAKWKNKK